MQRYILIYILMFGILSSVIWECINKKYSQENRRGVVFLKTLLFFYASHYFVISAVKMYLGDNNNSLYESFWDIEAITYIHYSIPLILIGIILPVLIKLIFRANGRQFIRIFDCSLLVLLLFAFILRCHISIMWYCLIYAISFVIAAIVALLYKKDIEFISIKEYKSYISDALPVICACVMTVGIYLPNELYLNNPVEFPGSYWVFLAIMIIASLLTGAALTLMGLLFLPKRIYGAVNVLLSIMVLMGYIQNMFLNGELQSMDGVDQVWEFSTKLINAVIWIVVIMAVILIGHKKNVIFKACKLLCWYIALIQAFSLVYLVITSDLSTKEYAALTNKGALQIAENDNVLVFVLDCYEGDWFEEILEEDEDFTAPLADFTYYRNGTAKFFHTAQAIPYMLTGVEWDEAHKDDYYNYAYGTSDLLKTIYEQGFDLGIYTALRYIPDSVYPMLPNYNDNMEYEYNVTKVFKMMVNASLYKMSPFCMKIMHSYYSGDIVNYIVGKDAWNIENDSLFHNYLASEGISVQEGLDKAFRFYHMFGLHAPFCLTDDLRYDATGRESSMHSQGRGSMKIVYEYLEQLKQLGKYDDATIIITADHGQGTIMDDPSRKSGGPDRTSRPVFIIKEPYEHNEAMVISNAPVSQSQLAPTYIKAVGLDWEKYGRTFSEISEDEQIERKVVECRTADTIFSVNGHAADLDSWTISDYIE